MNNTKDILAKIKDSGLQPRPRWQYLLLNFVMILLLGITVLLGGLVMSLVLLKVLNLDWDYLGVVEGSFLQFVPFVWLVCLGLLVFLAVQVFKNMEGGYRFGALWITSGAVFVSILMGGVIYAASGAEVLEKGLRENLPGYGQMEEAKEQQFVKPEKGIVLGQIQEVLADNLVRVVDLKGHEWQVKFAEKLAEKRDAHTLKTGQAVTVLGKQVEADKFEAKELRLRKAVLPKLKERIREERQRIKEETAPIVRQQIRQPAAPILRQRLRDAIVQL